MSDIVARLRAPDVPFVAPEMRDRMFEAAELIAIHRQVIDRLRERLAAAEEVCAWVEESMCADWPHPTRVRFLDELEAWRKLAEQ